MNEHEWAAVKWKKRDGEYYFSDGECEWRISQNEDGTWDQWERWLWGYNDPWLSNGTADTAEAAKLIF